MEYASPVSIAIVGTCLVLAYYYMTERGILRGKTKEDRERRTKIFLVYPAIVGILTWFLASCYLDYDVCEDIKIPQNNYVLKGDGVPIIGGKPFVPTSTEIMGRNNIRLPSTDVFIDLARF